MPTLPAGAGFWWVGKFPPTPDCAGHLTCDLPYACFSLSQQTLVCACFTCSFLLTSVLIMHKYGVGVMHYALCKIWVVSLCPKLGPIVK